MMMVKKLIPLLVAACLLPMLATPALAEETSETVPVVRMEYTTTITDTGAGGTASWMGKYTGETVDGVPHGFGVFEADAGWHYLGDWDKGLIHGEGKTFWHNTGDMSYDVSWEGARYAKIIVHDAQSITTYLREKDRGSEYYMLVQTAEYRHEYMVDKITLETTHMVLYNGSGAKIVDRWVSQPSRTPLTAGEGYKAGTILPLGTYTVGTTGSQDVCLSITSPTADTIMISPGATQTVELTRGMVFSTDGDLVFCANGATP